MGAFEIVDGSVAGLAEVGEFYDTVGYRGGVSPADTTLIARGSGRLLGAVRLCTEGGVIVLRGMQVDPAFQGKGVGRALLSHCMPYLDKKAAYCVPYDHLANFYGRVGFVETPPELLPEFLAARLAEYVAANRKTVAMSRRPSW